MYKYKAFISYRHIPFDSYIAEKLLKLIETYKKPHNISQDKRKEYWKCFRDEEEISISSDIGKEIHNALENSEYLIVVCSPELLKSEWCLEEISYFKKIHGGSTDNIIAVLIDGKPETAFPASLTSTIIDGEECAVEPLAAEIKGNSVKDSLKKLKTKYLKIVARFLDCEYDDLIQRENRRKRKKLILFSCIAIAVLTVIIIIISISFATVSNKNKTISQQYNELEEKNKLIDKQYSSIRHEYADNLISSAKTQYDNGLLMEAKENCNEALGYLDENDDLNYDVEYILSKINGTYDEFKFYPYCKLSHDNNVQLSEFVGNGETLFTSDGNNIYFWNTENGELRNRYSHTELGIENNAYFYFDKDGTDVYSMYGKALIKFDGLTGDISYTFKDIAHDIYINDEILAIKDYIFTENEDEIEKYFINIYDADSLELVKTLSFSQDFLQNENTNGNFAVEYHKPIIYSPNSLRVMYYDETIIFVSLDSKLMAAKIIDNVIQTVSLVCNFEYEDYQFFGNTFNNVFNMKYDLLVRENTAYIFYKNRYSYDSQEPNTNITIFDLTTLDIIDEFSLTTTEDFTSNKYLSWQLDLLELVDNELIIGAGNFYYTMYMDPNNTSIEYLGFQHTLDDTISDYYFKNGVLKVLLSNGSELVFSPDDKDKDISRTNYGNAEFKAICDNKYAMLSNDKSMIYLYQYEKNTNYT
ncbi:MAG: toll/interleukin-1 receptor domain-containing protein, partial [Ruminococcus sp.]|nr:toll/interleukin-1 receptor domain-containing protein [Ruminococcus sp.]